MGNAARENADGFQSLRIEERLLGFELIGNVTEYQHHADDPALTVANGRTAVGNGNFAPVAPYKRGMIGKSDDAAGREYLVDRVDASNTGKLIDDVEHIGQRPSGTFRKIPSGQFLRNLVHEGDRAADVGGDHAVADAADGHQETLALLGEFYPRSSSGR